MDAKAGIWGGVGDRKWIKIRILRAAEHRVLLLVSVALCACKGRASVRFPNSFQSV